MSNIQKQNGDKIALRYFKLRQNMTIKKLIAIVIFIAGGVLISYPIISNFAYELRWHYYEEQITKQTIDKQIENSEYYKAMWKYAEEYNNSLIENQTLIVTDTQKTDLMHNINPLGNGVIGYINIPKINVSLPIFQGTDEVNLQSGAGWWLGTSFPMGNSGSCVHSVITAHNGLIKAKMFTDLNKLDIGDTFNLQVLDKVFEYSIINIETTLPSDTDKLKINSDSNLVTLYTCTPYGVNSHRLLVTGEFIQEISISSQDIDNKHINSIMILIAFATPATLAMCVLCSIIYKKYKARRNEGT